MNTLLRTNSLRTLAVLALAALLSRSLTTSVGAAVPEVVGVLALAVEDEEVANELKLSDQQKQDLQKLVERREDEVWELALQLKGLPQAEQTARLAPFRKVSESLGQKLLSPGQWVRLRQIRIRRAGPASLAEPEVAQQLKLTQSQRDRIAQLLDNLTRPGDPDQRRIAQLDTQRKLVGVLTPEQRAGWEALTGGPPTEAGRPAPDGPPGPQKTTQQDQAAPEDTEPSDTEPSDTEPSDAFPKDISPPGPPPPQQRTGKLRFNFRFQPWQTVLEWFADQADLSLVLDTPPPGTFNYTDDREYTPAEAIDLLNTVLLVKGYMLVRHQRMLFLINIEEDEIPPNIVSVVPLDELDKRGEYELVTVLFPLERVKPEEIAPEIENMVGPQGAVVALPSARQLQVTETVGRIRAIRTTIQRMENPEGLDSQWQSFELRYATADEVLTAVRQLLQIPEEANATVDGSLKFAVVGSGLRLLVTGKPELVSKFEQILKAVDMPGEGPVGDVEYLSEAPQLLVHRVRGADPETVLLIMQTLLAGRPDVRLSLDPKTGNLVALARPSEQATIKAILADLEPDASEIEVIQLSRIDPQLAVLSINKLFGATGEEPDPNAPVIDADPTSRQLLIRATPAQIKEIRSLLQKMGETERAAVGDNVRVLPLTGWAAESALKQAQEIWPSMYRNQIRVVSPSASGPSNGPGPRISMPGRPATRPPSTTSPAAQPTGPMPERPYPGRPYPGRSYPPQYRPGQPGSEPMRPYRGGSGMPYRPTASPQARPAAPSSDSAQPPNNRSTQRHGGVQILLTSWRYPEELRPAVAVSQPPRPEGPASEEPAPAEPAPAEPVPPEPAPAEPAPAEPAPAEPAPAEPVPPEPVPPEPTPVEPVPQDPMPTEPVGQDLMPIGPVLPEPGPGDLFDPAPEVPVPEPTTGTEEQQPGVAPIIVAPGQSGLMIISEDAEAADRFEDLLTMLAGGTMGGGPELGIYYLKYATAAAVAQTLDQVLGGGTLATESGGSGGGMLGDLASAALGDGGGIMGALLGLGGGGGAIAPSGSIRITPDARLNALFVQAGPVDHSMIEKLLKYLDQKESPEEVVAVSRAKVIQLYNTLAEDIAAKVKELYQDRMVTSSSGGGRQPSPEQFIRMLSGGRGGRGGSSRGPAQEVQKMSVSADTTTNSVLVAAPEPLLSQVEELVHHLDQMALESNDQAIRVITLHETSSETVQRALSSMMGDSVRFGGSSSSSRSRTSSSSRPSSDSPEARRAAFIEMMRQRGGFFGRGGPPGGGPPGGGPPGRGGPPGGGPPGGGPPGRGGSPR